MTNEVETTYMAVITVETPDSAVPIELSVTLYPNDQIEMIDPESQTSTVKPLRECTLEDLMVYADGLEHELSEAVKQTTLKEIAKSEDTLIKVRLPKEVGEKINDHDMWWKNAQVALPSDVEEMVEPPLEEQAEELQELPAAVDELEKEAEADAVEDSEAENALPEVENEAEAASAEAEESVEPGEEAESELDPDPADESAPAEQPQAVDWTSLIVVSDPEPVIEERATSETEPSEERKSAVHVVQRKDVENRVAGYRLPLEDPTPAAVDVLFDEHPFRVAQAHASSSMTREVAGMLVGPPPEKQPNGRYVVHVTDVIEAKFTKMQGASVTYTPESWRYVNDVLLERYPNEECVIVGWYHTHPGFGIFLSNMDLFIHHNFFTQKWHIALVLDPVGKRSGFFTWNRAQSEVMGYHFPWPYWAHSSW